MASADRPDDIARRRARLSIFLALAVVVGLAGCAARQSPVPGGDDALQARVEAVLSQARDVNAAGLTVDARDGTVMLAGVVSSGFEQQSVGAIVRAVPGVTTVTFAVRVADPRAGR